MMTSNYTSQKGSALLICIILLMALTYLAVTAVQTGVMEVRMASATEEQMNAFQTAQSALDYVMSDTDNFVTTGATGIPNAVTLSPATNSTDAFYADTATPGAAETVTAATERTVDCGAPPRTSVASSLLAFSSFEFRIHGDVDKTSTNRGRSYQRQGYILLGPAC